METLVWAQFDGVNYVISLAKDLPRGALRDAEQYWAKVKVTATSESENSLYFKLQHVGGPDFEDEWFPVGSVLAQHIRGDGVANV
jgi:hypothetical protein